MLFTQTITGLATAALLALVPGATAFTTPCLYESYKCGYNMIDTYGYTPEELAAAVNGTSSIPPLSDAQLLKTLFRCTDTLGAVAGNSYCIAGCIGLGTDGVTNDMCAM